MVDEKTPIVAFLSAAAAKQPTPGGGSVAALAGALAASMGEMTLNYSIGKKELAAFDPRLRSALAEMNLARQLLLGLMVEDQQAYEAIVAAKKLPADAPQREPEIAGALLAGIRVPQVIGATALAILQRADALVEEVNRYLLSDLAVCCELSMATIRSSIYNVRANLPEVSNPAERAAIAATADKLLDHALVSIQRTIPRIWARHSKPA